MVDSLEQTGSVKLLTLYEQPTMEDLGEQETPVKP